MPCPLRNWMIGVDWIPGLPTTAAVFNVIQNHIYLLSGKVHNMPMRATAAEAVVIIHNMCSSGFPYALTGSW